MSQNRRVAVCIVTHNSAEDLPSCLPAVEALEHRPLELVVVDCASTDGSLEVAKRSSTPSLSPCLVPLSRNEGFAGGMNVALAHTDAPFILSLNADAQPEPTYLSRLLECFEDHADLKVGAITGRLLRPGSSPPTRLDACGMRLTVNWRHLDRGSGRIDRGQWMHRSRVFGATGAASLFVRRALDDVAVDGEVFDAVFHSFREDVELCFRLRERGWEVLYEPAARAVHRRLVLPQRRRTLPPFVNYHSLKNRYLLRLYHQTGGNFVWTLLPVLLRDVLIFLYVLVRERPSLSAYGWLWRNRRRIFRRRQQILARRSVPRRAIDLWFLWQEKPL